MNIYIIIFIVFVFVILLGVFLVFKFKKNTKISSDKIKFFNTQLKRTIMNSSYKEQIIDIDKLYHKILQEIGYTGTFGDILKSKPNEIFDIDKIWELHKLRNKLVHDFDLLSERKLREKSEEYIFQIKIILKKIS